MGSQPGSHGLEAALQLEQVRRLLRAHRRHEGAEVRADHQETLGVEHAHRLAHGHPRRLEVAGDLLLGEPHPPGVLTGDDALGWKFARARFLLTSDDKWILLRLDTAIAEVSSALAEYRFADAANALYRFFWSEYCDWYVEASKASLGSIPSAESTPSMDSMDKVDDGRRANTLAVMDFWDPPMKKPCSALAKGYCIVASHASPRK